MKTKNKSVVKYIRFEILKDGWIKDNLTGLEWGACSNYRLTLNLAKTYCIDNGGRLPTRGELETLQDLEKYNPCIEKSIFKDTKSDYYWSITPCAWDKNVAWCVSFYYGGVNSFGFEVNYNYVRPVRASQ